MSSVRPEVPVAVHNPHYGASFVRPKIRNWPAHHHAVELYGRWQKKIPVPPVFDKTTRFKNWSQMAQCIKETALSAGHDPGSSLCFLDHIPGPMTLELKPGQTEPAYDELAAYQRANPHCDWAAAFADGRAQTSESPEEHRQRTRR